MVLTRGAPTVDVDSAESGTDSRASSARRFAVRHADGLSTLAVLAVSLGSAAWFTRSFYYFQDDFIFIRQAQTSSLSLTYLRGPLFQHFSPGVAAGRLRPRSLVPLQCRCRPHHRVGPAGSERARLLMDDCGARRTSLVAPPSHPRLRRVAGAAPSPGMVDRNREHPARDPLRTAHDRRIPPIPTRGESKMDRGLALELRPVVVHPRTVVARRRLPHPLRPLGLGAWRAPPRSARPAVARGLDLARLWLVDGPGHDQLLRLLLRPGEAKAHDRRTDPVRRYSVHPGVRSFRYGPTTTDHRVDQHRRPRP